MPPLMVVANAKHAMQVSTQLPVQTLVPSALLVSFPIKSQLRVLNAQQASIA